MSITASTGLISQIDYQALLESLMQIKREPINMMMDRKEKLESTDSAYDELIGKANECLQCGKCTGVCPMAELFPEYFNPHHLLERLLIDPEKILEENDLWFCASCYRCNRVCPQGIELPDIFLKLRSMAVKEKGLENLEKALEIIEERVPFPGSFLWVCFHPERIPIDKNICPMPPVCRRHRCHPR